MLEDGKYVVKDSPARHTDTIYGKVLRLTRDGAPAPGNPFGNLVYAYGFRNSFGITVDPATRAVFLTENGPDSTDEVNRVEAGEFYGWPTYLGCCDRPPNQSYVNPLWDSGGATPVPTGIVAYRGGVVPALDGRVVFCNFKFGRLVSLTLSEDQWTTLEVTEHSDQAWRCGASLTVAPNGDIVFQDVVSMRLVRVVGSAG